jgi:hypothetical protein
MNDNSFRKYAVKANSVEDFARRYHVRNRMYLEEFALLVKSSKEEVEKFGYTFFPAHISVSGETVSYFPNKTHGGKK